MLDGRLRRAKRENMKTINSKKLLPSFIVRFLIYYFLYGYLFLLFTVILVFMFHYFYRDLISPYNLFSFIFLVIGIICFVRFFLIAITTRYKWRFYRISIYRLKNRKYSENYFKYEMFEPCMRLIIKDLLRKFGYKKEYQNLFDKYSKTDTRIEDIKDRLLKSAMRKYE